MKDYIGKYVKEFESGSKGSLALGSCGNDWGLSCGSYQLTLRWGNCIKFLKKYFPEVAKDLYFHKLGDKTTNKWPGAKYCSSPDQVKKVWKLCYESIGAEGFFEYEHDYIQSAYYEPLMKKIEGVFNPNIHSRALQECLWSWSVHKGSTGACNGIKSLKLKQSDSVETLLNKIYNYRYKVNKFNRYSNSSTSERCKLLRIKDKEPLPYNGSNGSAKSATTSDKKPKKVTKSKKLVVGIYRIISNDGMVIREGPGKKYKKKGEVDKGQAFTFVEFKGDWGLLKSYAKKRDGWINCNPKYCKLVKKI